MTTASGLTIVLVADESEALARCLSTLPFDISILVGGTEAGRDAFGALTQSHNAQWIGGSGVDVWNSAAQEASGDLLILDERTELADGTLDALLRIASASPDIATVTPVSNDASFLSVPHRNLPWPLPPDGMTPEGASRRVRNGALGLHPRIPSALSHASVIRRPALELLGAFDETLDPQDALADFSSRAIATGLRCVAADDVFVAHRGTGRPMTLKREMEDAAWSRDSALSRALLAASVALEPMTVTVDARSLSGALTGTNVAVIDLLWALSNRPDVRVRALMPKSLNREVELMVSSIDRCEMVNEQEISNLARTHVAHRPWQVESLADLELLDRLGERTVITQQDLIGYHTPAVFEDRQRWLDYRRTTADALGLASSTIFYTRHAADDAIREDLVDEQRVHIAPLAPPTRATLPITTQRPAALDEIAEPFLLVLGNRFRHKNGRFAQELVSVLRSDHGWDGHLVFAGAEVLHGSGSGDDAAWRLKHPGSDSYIHELGAVGEANKAWLLCNAAGVVYPTTNEGWGLVPAEANNAGVPCLFAPVSALAETMPSELALLQPWNAAESAARVRPVLEEGDARTDFLNRMTAALGDKTWDQTADRVVDAYRAAVSDPVPPAAVLRADMVANESRYWAARDALSGDAWKLVGPDDPLLDEEATRLLVSIVRSTRQLRWLKGVLARRARLRSMLRR